MKKLSISILAIIFSLGTAFAQPVSDLGIIPIGVTLNSILRLNVTSGGNIEYVINTIGQYTIGIPNISRYDTHFTVASSVDFDVTLGADAASFTGVDDPNNTLDLDNLGYEIASNGAGVDGINWDLQSGVEPLTVGSPDIVTSIPTFGAGDTQQNAFVIEWELGTSANNMEALSLLEQSITSDRYVVNVILELMAH